MAPEQARNAWFREGPATDLYAVGVTAWVLATGRLPPLTSGSLPPLVPTFPLPAELEGWILRCTEPDPRDRYGAAADALYALPEATVPAEAEAPMAVVGSLLDLGGGATWAPSIDAPVREPAPLSHPPPLGDDVPDAPTGSSHGLGAAPLRVLALRGREPERARLWEELRAVTVGEVRVVVLRGGAGTGKSRLARWVCEQAAEQGAAWPVRVRHGEGAGALDQALTDLLRLRDAPPEREGERIAALVPDCASDVRALRSGTLPTGQRHEVFRAAFAERAGRPVVVWLDDAHEDPEAAAFARRWQVVGGPPSLLVLTVRDDQLADRPEVAARLDELVATTLHLAPLDDATQAELVRQIAPCAPDVVAQIVRQSRGNPLFVVQVVLDWITHGELDPTDEGFAPRSGEGAVPDDLHGVWRRRVEGLLGDEALRRPLLVAAALGREVVLEEWEAACTALGAAGSRLVDSLVAEGLASLEVEPPRLVLAHGLLREALLPLVTPDIHRACAAALLHPSVADRGAWHLHAAGDVDDALRTSDVAVLWWGSRDMSRFRALLARMEGWTELLPEGDERRIEPKLQLARLLYLDGDPSLAAQIHQIRGFTSRWPHSDRVARIHLQLEAMLATLEGRTDEVPALLERALDHCALGKERQRVLGDLLVHHAQRGHYRCAMEAGERVLRVPDGDPTVTTWVLLNLAVAHLSTGGYAEAEELLAKAERSLPATDSPLQRAQLHSTRGALALERGDLAAARRCYEVAVSEWSAIGVNAHAASALELISVLAGEKPATATRIFADDSPHSVMVGVLRAAELRDWAEVERLAGRPCVLPSLLEARIWRQAAERAREAGASTAEAAAGRYADTIDALCGPTPPRP
ncbi:MAG: AAA family ATPase [Alphaproteobacteria bacterium]|nr:AAA family ATPase [Alphaproteobacteria bacterium]